MSVGKVVGKADYDTNSGSLAAQINEWAQDVVNLSSNLQTMSESDLTNLGYSSEEVTLLRTCVNDMFRLAEVYYGHTELTPAYDFRQFLNRISGLNSVSASG